MKKIKSLSRTYKLLILAILLFSVSSSFLIKTTQALATTNQQINSSCNNPTYAAYYDDLNEPIVGSIYIRTVSGTTTGSVNLYSDNAVSSNSCQLIGSATINSNEWTYLGNTPGANNLILEGQELNAEPYAAVADILSVPGDNICQPTISCTTTYDGFNGSLQPNLISDTTDQIAVYLASPINNLKYTSVNYYSNGKFLYSSSKLRPINHNYLAGGTQAILTQVKFANGEDFNINMTINMGPDWSGVLRVRSSFYRSHNRLEFIGIILISLVLILSIILLARIIYKRREFKVEHGIVNYEEPKKTDDNSSDNNQIITG